MKPENQQGTRSAFAPPGAGRPRLPACLIGNAGVLVTTAGRTVPRLQMKIRRAVVILLAAYVTGSCSEKSTPTAKPVADTPSGPRDLTPAAGINAAETTTAPPPPSQSQIERECLAVLRATKVIPAQAPSADCPGCPSTGTEVLSVRQMKTDSVSCAADACQVVVTIRALFNPGSGETISGGLTAWIPPEQRKAYLRGEIPTEDQVYRVQVTYHYREGSWRPVEFDRAPVQ